MKAKRFGTKCTQKNLCRQLSTLQVAFLLLVVQVDCSMVVKANVRTLILSGQWGIITLIFYQAVPKMSHSQTLWAPTMLNNITLRNLYMRQQLLRNYSQLPIETSLITMDTPRRYHSISSLWLRHLSGIERARATSKGMTREESLIRLRSLLTSMAARYRFCNSKRR